MFVNVIELVIGMLGCERKDVVGTLRDVPFVTMMQAADFRECHDARAVC